MSNFSLVEDTPPHRYQEVETSSARFASATSQTGVKSWQIDMLVVIVGLSALLFFVALGGAFALLGPGVIYMGVLSIRKRAGLGRQLLRIITGAALCCLSAAVLLAPVHANFWRISGGILCLLAGSSYIAAVFLDRRKI